jgi:hypothetical protein
MTRPTILIRCLRKIFTDTLPCNDRSDIHIDTQTEEGGFTKYAVEMGSVAIVDILIGGGMHRHKQDGNRISLL